MDIRKLIREAVAKSIPYEHQVEVLRDTNMKTPYHLGSKALNAVDFGLGDKKLVIKPVENIPSEDYHKRIRASNRTEREKDYDRFMEDRHFGSIGGLERAIVEDAPRLDVLMCGAVLKNFNVNSIFEDVNGSFVVHLSLEPKVSEEDANKIKAFIPGGEHSMKALKGVSEMYNMDLNIIIEKFKKAVRLEMAEVNDELLAITTAKVKLMGNVDHYDALTEVGGKKENSMGVSAYSKPNATTMEKKLMNVLSELNEVFGTNYFIDVSYPSQFEEVFVVKSGKKRLSSDEPLSYGQFLDFDKVIESQQRLLKAMEAMNGLQSITADTTPWRDILEPMDIVPVRAAIVGTSHRNG